MASHSPTVKQGAINVSSTGDNTIIASSSTTSINVYGVSFTVTGATNVTFKDSINGNLTGAFVMTGNGSSITLPMQDEPWFSVPPGSAFIINQSGSVTLGGAIWYTVA